MSVSFERTIRFDKSLKHLKKRYPKIAMDLIKSFDQLEANPSVGMVIPHDFSIRKLRVASSDMQRGKSGGFRLLYKLTIEVANRTIVTLLYLYAKTEQSDVSTELLETLEDDSGER
jgi:mRNA-degrading endonuclease RelE of RelBE toxin-antitoxin system